VALSAYKISTLLPEGAWVESAVWACKNPKKLSNKPKNRMIQTELYIDIHTHYPPKLKHSIGIVNHFWHENITQPYASLGNHPAYLSEKPFDQNLLSKICCFGESGLDKLCKTPFEQQERAFVQQIILSEKHQKPLLIHCVKAFAEIERLKKQYQPQMPWILHGFNKNSQLAQQLASKGFYFSFGAALFTKPKQMKAVLSQIPISQCFLETDHQTTFDIADIYQQFSLLTALSLPDIQANILQNFTAVFNTSPYNRLHA
jgi:TatD DNase family protein